MLVTDQLDFGPFCIVQISLQQLFSDRDLHLVYNKIFLFYILQTFYLFRYT